MLTDPIALLESKSNWAELQNWLLSLEETDLVRVGRLLRSKGLEAVTGSEKAKSVQIALTASFNPKLAIDAFVGAFSARGMNPLLSAGDYGQYQFDVGNPGSTIYKNETTAVICILGIDAIFSRLPSPFVLQDVLSCLEVLFEDIVSMIERHNSHLKSLLVISLPPEDLRFTKQLISTTDRGKANAALYQLYADVYKFISGMDNINVIIPPALRRTEVIQESERFTYARMPLSDAQLVEIAFESATMVSANMGAAHKALGVDLDGTLWSGIVGEGGAESLDAGISLRGAGHSRVQSLLKQLETQGIVLAVLTKNDLDNAISGIKYAPGMVLTEKDFVAIEASWDPKEWSLEKVAGSLNIAAEAFVFLDDHVAERGSMCERYPGVAVPDLSGDPATFADHVILHDPFATVSITSEDIKRTSMYRAESERHAVANSMYDKKEFLSSLAIKVFIRDAIQSDIARLSQLSLRTNQFHSAMLRMDATELAEWLAQGKRKLIGVEADDRFGSYGMVGMMMLEERKDCFRISNMILSCRVFSRGLEEAMLSAAINYALRHDYACIEAIFVETARNARVKELFIAHNFQESKSSASLFLLSDPSEQSFFEYLDVKVEI